MTDASVPIEMQLNRCRYSHVESLSPNAVY